MRIGRLVVALVFSAVAIPAAFASSAGERPVGVVQEGVVICGDSTSTSTTVSVPVDIFVAPPDYRYRVHDRRDRYSYYGEGGMLEEVQHLRADFSRGIEASLQKISAKRRAAEATGGEGANAEVSHLRKAERHLVQAEKRLSQELRKAEKRLLKARDKSVGY